MAPNKARNAPLTLSRVLVPTTTKEATKENSQKRELPRQCKAYYAERRYDESKLLRWAGLLGVLCAAALTFCFP